MTPLDRQIFLVINHGLHSGVNNLWIGYATWLGNGWVGFPIALLALFWIDRASFWRNVVLLAIAGTVGGIALNLIKHAVHAPRPLTVFAPEIAAGKVYVNVMFGPLYWNSFPSGHSQTAFTLATVLVWAGRRANRIRLGGTIGILAIASLVCISRMYVGAHFPSDVLGGAVLGSSSAYLCCYSMGQWRTKRLSLDSVP